MPLIAPCLGKLFASRLCAYSLRVRIDCLFAFGTVISHGLCMLFSKSIGDHLVVELIEQDNVTRLFPQRHSHESIVFEGSD